MRLPVSPFRRCSPRFPCTTHEAATGYSRRLWPAPLPARKALQNKANLLILAALLLDLGGYALTVALHIHHLNQVAGLVALPLWVIGCMAYAESKGYDKWLGLFGILSCCGLFVLAALPNKWVEPSAGGYGSGDYPRPNGYE